MLLLHKLISICKNTQSERTAKMLDPELSGAHLNSVSYSFNCKQEGRVTAVVAQARYQRATQAETRTLCREFPQ